MYVYTETTDTCVKLLIVMESMWSTKSHSKKTDLFQVYPNFYKILCSVAYLTEVNDSQF